MCLTYTNLPTPEHWRFRHPASGDEVGVSVHGRIRTNNADDRPALIAGHGLALQPEFLVWGSDGSAAIEVMADWKIADINVINLVTPPGMLRAARVTVLLDFLAEHFAHAPWALPAA